MPKSKKKYASKNTLALLLIALPGITYLIINNYIPIVRLKSSVMQKESGAAHGVDWITLNFCS